MIIFADQGSTCIQFEGGFLTWTSTEVPSGLLLVLTFFNNLGHCSNFFSPGQLDQSHVGITVIFLFFLPHLTWKSIGWAFSTWIERGRCSWVWISPACLLRAGFVVEAVMIWIWACPAVISRLCCVDHASFCALAAHIHGPVCSSSGFTSEACLSIQSSEFAITSVIWEWTWQIHSCVFCGNLQRGSCFCQLFSVLSTPQDLLNCVPSLGTLLGHIGHLTLPCEPLQVPGFQALDGYPVSWVHEHGKPEDEGRYVLALEE